jgi:uncharacterized protein YyaL (SSP411 family)
MRHVLLRLALAAILVTAAAPRASAAASEDDAYYAFLTGHVAAAFDSGHGGFVRSDAPATSAIRLALIQAHDRADALWMARARQSLDWSWTMYDSVGGGFIEKSRQADPMHASFEKRTWSNSQRFENLIDAWRVFGDNEYRKKAAMIADFFDRVLLDARGGFVAGQIGDRELVPELNGAAIHAYLDWAAASADPRFRNFALKSLDRAWTENWDADFGMMRHGATGDVLAPPQLVDQAEMGRAFVLGAHLSGRAGDLERARAIGDMVLARFEDREKGGWRTQAVPDKKGGTKRAARVPDENARTALFLSELASLTGDGKYRESARRGIQAFRENLEKAGLEAADWALAVRALSHPDFPERPDWTVTAPPQVKPRSKRYR